MSGVVIKVENLTKEYRLGVINHGTLAKDLQTWWARKRGKDDPNSPVTRHPSPVTRPVLSLSKGHPSPDEIYALKDINFEVRQGEVLGIIGANGAGKSTLLKILSRVTSPTSGCVKIKGRIGSLLEVGTGFHPELTGRENIYLNGAILGMKKWEIDKKLDEIIDFSGVERFIDTPVKRYSSGMYVRLAFAVAAHLDPEILVVDEVLAVGDAEFQKKCLGKMGDISKKEGRTVLFVSHSMPMVASLCDRCLLLQNSNIKLEGKAGDVIAYYQCGDGKNPAFIDYSNSVKKPGDEYASLLSGWIETVSGEKKLDVNINESFNVCMKYKILKDVPRSPFPNFHFFDDKGNCVFVTSSGENVISSCKTGDYIVKCEIPANFLNDGLFSVGLALTFMHSGVHVSFFDKDALMFNVTDPMDNIPTRLTGYSGRIPGVVRPLLNWKVENIK
jgi:lipopolysaccharide transport system ATP-binding protein